MGYKKCRLGLGKCLPTCKDFTNCPYKKHR